MLTGWTVHSPTVLSWVLVGFHAKHGHQIECAELADELSVNWQVNQPEERSGASAQNLSNDWLREVAVRALPDGAHERDHDIVYFTVRHCVTVDTLYGVACYRQRQVDCSRIASAEEAAATARGLVQKSVVLLSRWPLYALLASRLEPVVASYFAKHNFGQVDCFRTLVTTLNEEVAAALGDPEVQRLPVSTPVPVQRLPACLDRYVFGDTCLQQLVTRLRRDLLRLIKLVLLERRVLVVGSPVELVAKAVLSLVSVFPAECLEPPPNSGRDAALDLATCCTLAQLPFGLFDLYGSTGVIRVEPYVPLASLQPTLAERDADTAAATTTRWIVGVSTPVGRLFADACRSAGVFERSPVRSLFVTGRSASAQTPHSVPESMSPERSDTRPAKASWRPMNAFPQPPDALVHLERGRVYFTPELASLLELTRSEKRFIDELVHATARGALNESAVRARLQWYIVKLALIAAVAGDDAPMPAEQQPALIDELGLPFFQHWNRHTTHFRRWHASLHRAHATLRRNALGHVLRYASSMPTAVDEQQQQQHSMRASFEELDAGLGLHSLRQAWMRWWRSATSTDDTRRQSSWRVHHGTAVTRVESRGASDAWQRSWALPSISAGTIADEAWASSGEASTIPQAKAHLMTPAVAAAFTSTDITLLRDRLSP
ncbi:hypothetical protein, conserved [Cyanidioschyzon merolae strain 10D]|uniref:AVL9/DENND6 domain-containing protein n=1 Tax=Cyanidioschyzon merolae (strain NIES-3377 / 10D) TaxID=280699 RepID=M1V9B5_CYAM1|nr:hypothetical protein, conserved [Cyanidioschyzon merolae strain 10D]BAM81354.1 hypothetical protein, conserved [Cyanidioschyzon merolae strain 10D]|eukprot:XP_005537390.1 hypothetical protein, conserved [Cyanidioschyzon merolae strain 10D]